MAEPYDAVVVVSFGGPEGPDDVLPFLENVLRGRNVPRERMLHVAENYRQFGGVSPLNAQNRALIAALVNELNEYGPQLPVYWGNRNWHPLLADTVAQMKADGIRRALAFVTSAYSSYSSCRQYLEDIHRARAAVGAGAPVLDKLRPFFNHPGFIEPQAELVRAALDEVPAGERTAAQLVFTAHSIPIAMAQGCRYEQQLLEVAGLMSEAAGHANWKLVYQSRSGPPRQPWLEPDICDYFRELPEAGGVKHVVVVPIGFVSDHMEIVYDLDTVARGVCEEIGLNLIRVPTVGTHPRFIRMIRQLIEERIGGNPVRAVIGRLEVCPHVCPSDCCPSGK